MKVDVFEGVLEKALEALTNSDDDNTARWYIEIARHSRFWLAVYDPWNQFDNYGKKQEVFNRLHEFRVFSSRSRRVAQLSRREDQAKHNNLASLI